MILLVIQRLVDLTHKIKFGGKVYYSIKQEGLLNIDYFY